jgi:aconitase A
VNDEGGEVNVAFDHGASEGQAPSDTIPAVAKRFKSRNQPWSLVVDDNYGEGSAREHAVRRLSNVYIMLTFPGSSTTILRCERQSRHSIRDD